jgi:aryl-alcohol dehydrogenase-like predicted oxidoreductase
MEPDEMSRRTLGNSAIAVEPLALGGNVFGWSADETTSFAVLDAFVGEGLNFIDTADGYSAWVPGNLGGESETIIGKWLKRSGRHHDVVIGTKVGKWAQRKGLAAVNIAAAADDSLRRLGVDCIDVYYAHEDDASVPLEETLGAFARLIEAGKVRCIGASNYGAERLAAALDASRTNRLPRYEVLQPEYNLVAREAYEAELEPLARRENLGVVPYYALASGFLTGKYRSEADLHKRAARAGAVRKYLNPPGLGVVGALDDVAARHRATPAQVALAWLLARPGITAPIASATSAAQVKEIAGATRIALSAEDIEALDQASAYA